MTILRRAICSIALAAVTAVAISLAIVGPWSSPATAADGAPQVSASDAIGRFSRVVPEAKNVQATLVKDSDGKHQHYKVTSDTAVGNVDASDGHVATLVVLSAVPTGNSVRIDESGAIDRSKAYLEQNGVAIDGFTPRARIVDHGSYKEWDVQWQRRVNGALTPETRETSVNPDSGTVFSLVNTSVPFSTPPTPTILQAKAATIAQKHLGWTPVSIESCDLVIAYSPNGSQVLAWQFVLSSVQAGIPQYARLNVDAIDGSVTDLGQG
jgi:hypothetical protein